MPRSGTKLLRGLLNRHPRIGVPAIETEFLPWLARHFEHFGDVRDPEYFDAFHRAMSRHSYFQWRREHGQAVEARRWQAACVDFSVAGVHSGDATLVLPPQRTYLETIRRIKRISARIARALKIHGPFNIQFLAKGNDVAVIERISRHSPMLRSRQWRWGVLSCSAESAAPRRWCGRAWMDSRSRPPIGPRISPQSSLACMRNQRYGSEWVATRANESSGSSRYARWSSATPRCSIQRLMTPFDERRYGCNDYRTRDRRSCGAD
jgi:hypothetical protein